MTSPLQKAFDFYLAHQGEMVEKYDGKYIVIKDETVLGAYDDEIGAVTKTPPTRDVPRSESLRRGL